MDGVGGLLQLPTPQRLLDEVAEEVPFVNEITSAAGESLARLPCTDLMAGLVRAYQSHSHGYPPSAKWLGHLARLHTRLACVLTIFIRSKPRLSRERHLFTFKAQPDHTQHPLTPSTQGRRRALPASLNGPFTAGAC